MQGGSGQYRVYDPITGVHIGSPTATSLKMAILMKQDVTSPFKGQTRSSEASTSTNKPSLRTPPESSHRSALVPPSPLDSTSPARILVRTTLS